MIGVDDRGRPIGKSLDEGLEKRLWEIVNHVESPGSIEMSSLMVGQVEIAVVSIGRRHQGVAQTSDGTVLIRRGGLLPLRSGLPTHRPLGTGQR